MLGGLGRENNFAVPVRRNCMEFENKSVAHRKWNIIPVVWEKGLEECGSLGDENLLKHFKEVRLCTMDMYSRALNQHILDCCLSERLSILNTI